MATRPSGRRFPLACCHDRRLREESLKATANVPRVPISPQVRLWSRNGSNADTNPAQQNSAPFDNILSEMIHSSRLFTRLRLIFYVSVSGVSPDPVSIGRHYRHVSRNPSRAQGTSL